MKKQRIVWNVVTLLVAIASFYTVIYLLIDNSPQSYSMLFMLPLVFCLSFFFLRRKIWSGRDRVVTVAFFCLSFVRMIITPLMIALSNYTIWFGYYSTVISISACEVKMPKAIILICFEYVVMLFALCSRFVLKLPAVKYSFTNKISPSASKKVLWGLILIFLLLTFRYPTLLNYLHLIGEEGAAVVQGNAPSYIYRVYLLIADILQFFVPAVLLYKIKKSRISFGLKLFCFFLIDAFVLVVMTEDQAISILYSMVFLVWFMKDCGKKPRNILIVVLCAVGILAAVMLMKKTLITDIRNKEQLVIISGMLNSYFAGPFNVAAALTMKQADKFAHFWGDLLNSIPFFPVFFGSMPTTPVLFNATVKGSTAVVSKIIPMVSQGQFYFTSLFAPLFSVISLRLSMYHERQIQKSTSDFMVMLCYVAAVLCVISPFIYNVNILIKNLGFLAIGYLLFFPLFSSESMKNNM